MMIVSKKGAYLLGVGKQKLRPNRRKHLDLGVGEGIGLGSATMVGVGASQVRVAQTFLISDNQTDSGLQELELPIILVVPSPAQVNSAYR